MAQKVGRREIYSPVPPPSPELLASSVRGRLGIRTRLIIIFSSRPHEKSTMLPSRASNHHVTDFALEKTEKRRMH